MHDLIYNLQYFLYKRRTFIYYVVYNTQILLRGEIMIEGLLSITEELLVLSNSPSFTKEEKHYILEVVRITLEVVVLELKKQTP